MKKKAASSLERDRVNRFLDGFTSEGSEIKKLFDQKGFTSHNLLISFLKLFLEAHPEEIRVDMKRLSKRSRDVLYKFFNDHFPQTQSFLNNFSVVENGIIIDTEIKKEIEQNGYKCINPGSPEQISIQNIF